MVLSRQLQWAVGVVVEKHGQEVRVKANKGILLDAGGFSHNAEMRQKYQGVGAEWTSASPGNTGYAIQAGEQVGGALALMDEAWWGGSFYMNGQINFSVYERSLPGCILLDEKGKRFVNESTSYVDFGRGNDIYDRYYSDPRILPNSNLAPIENAPCYAIKFYPGDLGTKGGLLTDEYPSVLKEDGSVIEGLYASGNNTASVMGRTYPGPGSTIGPACTFSYIVMKHLAETATTGRSNREAAKEEVK